MGKEKIIDDPIKASRTMNEWKDGKENFDLCSHEEKQMLFDLVFDLLPEKEHGLSGLFLERLLKENHLTYSQLSRYIYGYICFMEDPAQNGELDLEKIKSILQTMMTARRIDEKNKIFSYICDFFSVSEDVLKYGQGEKYTLDFEKAKEAYRRTGLSPKEFLDDMIEMEEIDNSKEVEACKYYITHSAKAFARIIEDRTFTENLLKKEEYSLLDEQIFNTYLWSLGDRERQAVLNCMKNIANMKKSSDNQIT